VARRFLERVRGKEEGRSMANLLLHHPLVQFYLLYVAVLVVVCIGVSLRSRPAIPDDSRTPRHEVGDGASGFFPSTASENFPRSVLRAGRRTDREEKPLRGDRRPQAPTVPALARCSGNRRENHFVTP
jgi:hypothetical protein